MILYIPLSAQASNLDGSIGVVVADFEYIEEGLMEEDGTLYGVSGYFATHDNWMLRLEGSYIKGEVDYTSNNTGSSSNIDDYIYEIRGLIGKDANINGSRLTTYTGIGYRYLNDDSSQVLTSTGHIGYEREQTYFYMPIGLLVNTSINANWAVEGQFEFDYLIRGKNKSSVGYLSSYSDDLSFTQDTGFGYRIAVSFIKKQNSALLKGISISPYIKYWHIDKSDTDTILVNNVSTTYIEPENKVTEYGLIFSLHF